MGTHASPHSPILLSPPDISDLEERYVLDAVQSGWAAPLGPHVDAIEAEFKARLGIAHAVALSSGTAALHLALLAHGVRRGDEVLVQSFTFAATANAVAYCGAIPVFIDSESSTWNLDPKLITQALEERAQRGTLPKAIVTVDLYGQCADYEAILPIAAHYGIPVIEDAAEAVGASLHGRGAGTFGHTGVFSFNGNKIITTSGGGMLVTDDDAIAQQVRYLATQAREPVLHYEHRAIGYNYRMSNILAAFGRAQLQRLPSIVAQTRQIRAWYHEGLKDLEAISWMPRPKGSDDNAWLTCLLLPDADQRDHVIAVLKRHNIESRPLWKPMHMQPVFADCPKVGGAFCEMLFARGLCLPSGSVMGKAEVARVIAALREALETQ